MYKNRVLAEGIFDNAGRAYRHIAVRPLAGAMGAEIVGLDANAVSDEAAEELRDAMWRHRMIFLRGQSLDDAGQVVFTRLFGTPAHDAFAASDDPDLIIPVIKQANERQAIVLGGGWHTDSTFLARPPALTILRSVDVPEYGGDTLFADAALAYRALSPAMQAFLEPLRVRFTAGQAIARRSSTGSHPRDLASDEVRQAALEGALHPLVRRHPETGEKALYISGGYATGIEGLQDFESAMLIEFLLNHITDPTFTCRVRWEPDMIVVWDNRLCLHRALNDYDGHLRHMRRSLVQGEVPLAA